MSVARIPFRAEEEAVVSQLGIWMIILSVLHFIGGAVLLLVGCLGMVGGAVALGAGLQGVFVVVGVLFLFVLAFALIGQGVVMLMARGAFQKVVATDEADQRYLSEGFRWLKVFFYVEIAVGLLSMVQAINDVLAVVAGGPAGGGL